MKAERHLEKAKRIEQTIRNLDPDLSWELIVEGAYGAAIHYIAYITDKILKKHQDMHKGLARFLDENGLSGLAELFRELDLLRQGKWYGGQENGETSERAIQILEKIRGIGGI